MCKCSNVQMFKCSNVQMYKCSNFKMFKCQISNVSKVKLLLEHTSGQFSYHHHRHGYHNQFISSCHILTWLIIDKEEWGDELDDFTCVPAAPCRAGRLYWRPSELSATTLCHHQYLPQQDCATPDCLPSTCFRLNTNLCKWLWGDCARRILHEISSSWSNEGNGEGKVDA